MRARPCWYGSKQTGDNNLSLPLMPGYWRSGPWSSVIQICDSYDACYGSGHGNDEVNGNERDYCRKGHHGPKCRQCNKGYELDEYRLCGPIKPPTNDEMAFVFLIWLISAVALIALVRYLKRAPLRRRRMIRSAKTCAKIIFVTQQVKSGFGSGLPSVRFPPIIESALRGFTSLPNPFGSLFFENVLTGLRFSMDHIGKFVAVILPPLALMVVFVILGICVKRWRKSILACSFAVAYLVAPNLGVYVVRSLFCEYFDDGKHVLVVDPALSCDSSAYTKFLLYVYFVGIVFIVGTHVSMIAILFLQKDKVRKPIEEREVDDELNSFKIQYLYDPYKPDFWWFELFELLKRFALTFGLEFITRDIGPVPMIMFAIYLMTAGLIVYCLYLPFTNKFENKLGILSNLNILSTGLASLLLMVSIQDDKSNGIDYTIIILNFTSMSFVPLAVLIFLRSIKIAT